jgi:transcriptional regulator with XRE-family HTH domain
VAKKYRRTYTRRMSHPALTSLKEARKAAGLNQAELAARVNVTNNTISRIERGQTVPSVAQAQLIAGALGVSMDSIWPPTPAPPTPRSDEPPAP